MLAELPRHVEAVDHGQAEIEEDASGLKLHRLIEGGLAVVGRTHVIAASAQPAGQTIRSIAVVIHDEDAHFRYRRRTAGHKPYPTGSLRPKLPHSNGSLSVQVTCQGVETDLKGMVWSTTAVARRKQTAGSAKPGRRIVSLSPRPTD